MTTGIHIQKIKIRDYRGVESLLREGQRRGYLP